MENNMDKNELMELLIALDCDYMTKFVRKVEGLTSKRVKHAMITAALVMMKCVLKEDFEEAHIDFLRR